MDAFARLVRSLERAGVRFVLISLAGANYYARSGATLFVTGSGLDLAIAREFAEAHGGAITAESRDGGGATFVLRLPREGPAPP